MLALCGPQAATEVKKGKEKNLTAVFKRTQYE
jgi:hypothetical protein